MHITEDTWYDKTTTSKTEWRGIYTDPRADITCREQYRGLADNQVLPDCSRIFHRECDMKRQCEKVSGMELFIVQFVRGCSEAAEDSQFIPVSQFFSFAPSPRFASPNPGGRQKERKEGMDRLALRFQAW